MSDRQQLPPRRANLTQRVVHTTSDGGEKILLATFSPGADGKVREIFCADFKAGTDTHHIIVDGCVMASRLLQSGLTAADLVDRLCRPTSILGTLIRTAADIDKEGLWS